MVLSALQVTVISYLVVFIGTIILVNGFSQGFFFKFLRVKASRGKKILIRIHGMLEPMFRIGHLNKDGRLIFRESLFDKTSEKGYDLTAGSLRKELGINVVDLDTQGRILIREGRQESELSPVVYGWNVVRGFDPERVQHLFVREAERPQIDGNKNALIVVVGILAFFMLLFIAYYSFKNGQKLDMLLASTNAIRDQLPKLLNATMSI